MSTQVERSTGLFSGDAFDSSCPSRSVLDHVTSKWAVLVLVVLSREDHRFSALRRAVGGISEKMLAQTLRTLEGDGFVHREVAATTPPQVSYGLTELGHGVTGHLAGLVGWIEDRIPEVLAARERS